MQNKGMHLKAVFVMI